MTASHALTVVNRDRRADGAADAAVTSDPPGADLGLNIGHPMWFGFALIAVFVLGFGVWGATAPLAGGAVATGVISPDGSKKTVQHLEGGIIGKLLVRDGDTVAAGQPLLVLEDIQPRATYRMLIHQHRALVATQARLLTEKTGGAKIVWPAELRPAQPDQDLTALLDDQRQMFVTRQTTHRSRQRVLKQRVQQLNEQILGLEAQVESTSQQLVLIADEIKDKQFLLSRGLVPKPELLKLQRAKADILGRRGAFIGDIAAARQQIGETELKMLQLDAERADEIATQLDQLRSDLADLDQKLFASKDVLNRTVVAAPVGGTVVNLKFKTEGGVVLRGEPILDIVPTEDKLLIDARVSPTDIDVVQIGLTAKVRLLAYSSRILPQIPGVVRSLSADRLLDDATRQPYYLARVEVDREALKRIDPDITLIPGMPAEVLIVTGERTLLQYLLKPFLDVLNRSFREV